MRERECRLAVLVLLLLAACSSGPQSRINTTADGVAVKGYDPVAYFTENRPVKGSREFEFQWRGAAWRFANAGHLALFKENPEKYAPQYGGY